MPVRFGPAGLGPVKEAISNLENYHKLGFKACEIAFTYSNYIKPEQAELIKDKAKELDIELTIHGSYFINLNAADKEKLEASKKRILDACEIGELLGAKCVVFHPGFYGSKAPKPSLDKKFGQASDFSKLPREKAQENILKAVKAIQKTLQDKKWKIQIAPETMGKVNVFGSIEEISNLVKETGCSFCIDFAHILARDKSVDYKLIKSLFPQKAWHCHFSGIVYGEKGEKHHRKTERKEWQTLLANLPKDKDIRIINESPSMVEDSVEGLKLHNKS